jgi:tRNA threonylcarbamoyladenosine biosynthesis protein TsaB
MKILAIDTATEACSAALYIDDAGNTDDTKNKSISSRYQLAPREHSRLILKMIDELLAQAELSVDKLDAIAFGQGPGSFMGLRIASGVVQGIAFAHDIPVIPVSTLKAIAQRAYEDTGSQNVIAAIDARMDEVYWAAYSLKENRWHLHGEESVISPDKITLPEMPEQSGEPGVDEPGIGEPMAGKPGAGEPGAGKDSVAKNWVGAGSGWASYQDRLLKAADCRLPTILTDCLPSAKAIVKLAVDELKSGKTVTAARAVPVYIRNDVAKKPKPIKL